MSYNLEHLVHTDIATSIDDAVLAHVLSSPPFALVPGTFNVRDICPTSSQALRQGYIYRSGTLENIEELGMTALRDDLKVTTVFDLRSSKERQTAPAPEIPGIEVIFIASTWDNYTRTEAQKPAGKEEYSATQMYLDLLESHKDAYRGVLVHVRDNPDKPLLFHCTAGKDRTGVLAGILHGLAGTPLSEMDLDYALTRIGIEPVREFLLHKLTGGKLVDMTTPKMKAYASVHTTGMSDLMHAVHEKYGGIDGYVATSLGFLAEDIETIKKNLKSRSFAPAIGRT